MEPGHFVRGKKIEFLVVKLAVTSYFLPSCQCSCIQKSWSAPTIAYMSSYCYLNASLTLFTHSHTFTNTILRQTNPRHKLTPCFLNSHLLISSHLRPGLLIASSPQDIRPKIICIYVGLNCYRVFPRGKAVEAWYWPPYLPIYVQVSWLLLPLKTSDQKSYASM